MIKDVRLTDAEYDFLNQAYCDKGSEGKIIRKGKYAIKLFNEDFGNEDYLEDEIEEIRENKFNKIKLLYEKKDLLNNEFYPLETISYNGRFVGYKGYWFNYLTYQFACLSRKEHIFYLKKLREKLRIFHELGIVYGDIKDDNILIDVIKKDVIFLDLDNIKIDEYPIDMMNYYVKNFNFKYHNIDDKLDSYMLNLLTLDKLFPCYEWYNEVINRLELGYIPKCFLNSSYVKAKKLSHEMVNLDRKYSGKYFIDML